MVFRTNEEMRYASFLNKSASKRETKKSLAFELNKSNLMKMHKMSEKMDRMILNSHK